MSTLRIITWSISNKLKPLNITSLHSLVRWGHTSSSFVDICVPVWFGSDDFTGFTILTPTMAWLLGAFFHTTRTREFIMKLTRLCGNGLRAVGRAGSCRWATWLRKIRSCCKEMNSGDKVSPSWWKVNKKEWDQRKLETGWVGVCKSVWRSERGREVGNNCKHWVG